jgi:hypothetical protein
MIEELINNGFRGCRRKQQLTSLRYYFCICLEDWKNQKKNLSQDSQSPHEDTCNF